MKKRILSFLLVAVMLMGVIPFAALAVDTDANSTEGTAIVPDTTWYIEDMSVYYLYDAADLLGFAALGNAGNDFAGKTVMLMADIDLNEGWNADVTIGSTVVFPEAPANVWADFANFKGILDGNGYTVSGMYSSKEVANNKGAYGGFFNTLDGGAVKNLKLTNSFLHTKHLTGGNKYGTAEIHVGGISGDVNAGSVLNKVFFDSSVEIWYQSDAHCMMGGAFGVANGAYTVEGFVFMGRIGNTSNACAANYDVPGTNNLCIALVTGNQNSKGGSIKNSLALKEGFYVVGNWFGESGNDRVAQVNKNATLNCIANTRESAAWLETRPTDYGLNFTWSDTVGSIIPKVAVDIVEGTFEHVVSQTELFYQTSQVSDGTYNIRFLSGIDSTASYNEVGFIITVMVNGESYDLPVESTMTRCVFSSIWAGGESVSAKDVGNGYEYLYACVIEGVTASDNVVIKIATANVGTNGVQTVSEFVYLGFCNGVAHIIAA